MIGEPKDVWGINTVMEKHLELEIKTLRKLSWVTPDRYIKPPPNDGKKYNVSADTIMVKVPGEMTNSAYSKSENVYLDWLCLKLGLLILCSMEDISIFVGLSQIDVLLLATGYDYLC